MLESITDERLDMGPGGQIPAIDIKIPEKVGSDAEMTVSQPTVEVEEVTEEKYVTPQPNIPRGTRIRNPKIMKNMRNQPCGCGSGMKFKKCCGPNIGSEQMYIVPSAQKD
jgi:hypothetical protein